MPRYPVKGLPLGPHHNFAHVPETQRNRGSRRLLFNFIGSIIIGHKSSRTGILSEREIMRNVVLDHTWAKPCVRLVIAVLFAVVVVVVVVLLVLLVVVVVWPVVVVMVWPVVWAVIACP